MSKTLLITDEIASQFICNPDDGILIWNVNKSRVTKGRAVTHINADGYLGVRVKSIMYLAHRICYYIYYRENPNDLLDHINNNKTDNRKINLRECNRSENAMNQKKRPNNTSGITGVYFNKKRNKWIARITFNRKMIVLGSSKDKYVAARIRKEGEKKYFGEFRYKGDL